ncbi:MAG: methylated-DNA--[protein]-cysteine S-methyltransferase [Candidatus Firestonebacteria bacterium]|nr:methylated-DNA--[protein]-cysteine S-methyltransferase [Candidatus Firestonebacteria bacterium]
MYYFSFESSLGKIYLGSTSRGLRFITFGKKYEFSDFISNAVKSEKPFKKIVSDIQKYLNGNSTLNGEYTLDLNGYTFFQLKVWKILRTIPYGEVRTYSWVGEKIGNPKSARAVGQANHTNPIPLIIPCHRVISKDGSLGGFRAGVKYKQILLDIENKYKK